MDTQFDEKLYWGELKKLTDTLVRSKDPLIVDGLREALVSRLKRGQGKVTYLPLALSEISTIIEAFPNLPIRDDAEEKPPSEAIIQSILNPQKENTTKEDEEQADALLRQARVVSMRGNRQEAIELMSRAVALAPKSVSVILALADEHLANRDQEKALLLLKHALELDPTNVALERRYAQVVFSRADAELKMSGFVANMNTESEIVANSKIAIVFSIIFPGLGQIVTGRVIRGMSYVAAFGAAFTLVSIFGWENVTRVFVPGTKPATNYFALISFVAGLIVYIVNVVDMITSSKQNQHRAKVSRPTPPSNLPFE